MAKEEKDKSEGKAHLAMFKKSEAIRSDVGKASDIHSDGKTR